MRALREKVVRRVILTRPAVEAGEKLGFLPGDMKEKLDPYLQPLYDALNDMIPPARLQKFMEEGTIQIAPLAYMRGRQIDLPRRSDSGLTRAIGILRGVKGIGVVEFDRRDIVRHELVKHIVEAFDRHGESEAPPVRTDRKS